MWLICIRYYHAVCGFPVLKVARHTPEMAGCRTGHQGPQATKQRLHRQSRLLGQTLEYTIRCLELGSDLLGDIAVGDIVAGKGLTP